MSPAFSEVYKVIFILSNCAENKANVFKKVYEDGSLLGAWKYFEWIIKQLLNSAFAG